MRWALLLVASLAAPTQTGQRHPDARGAKGGKGKGKGGKGPAAGANGKRMPPKAGDSEDSQHRMLCHNAVAHVEKALKADEALPASERSSLTRAEQVLGAYDDYGYNVKWLASIADKKGVFLDEAVRQALAATEARRGRANVLELGTLCGYSAVRIGRLLPSNAQLWTVDESRHAAVSAHRLSDLANTTRPHAFTGRSKDILADKRGFLTRVPKPLSLLFLDHSKRDYVMDLQTLKRNGYVQPGTVVVADNLWSPGAPELIKFMESSAEFSWEVHESKLEYSEESDAVGVAVMLGDDAPVTQHDAEL